MVRVKCIRTKAYPGAPSDPLLRLNQFYTVVDQKVFILSDDPFIRIKVENYEIERPRHLFGPFLKSE